LIFFFASLTLSYVAKPHDELEVSIAPHLKTGDILLLRHNKYKSSWMVGFVSHMCVIWEHSLFGPLVLDMNPSINGPFKTPLHFEHVIKGRSVVAIRFNDFLRFYPGDIYVRSLLQPMTLKQEQLFTEKLNWAFNLEYLQSITDREPLTWLTLATSHFMPQVSSFLSYFTALNHVRTSSFCTEMIAELFMACGVLPESHSSNLWAPIAWVKGVGSTEGLKDDLWGMQRHVIKSMSSSTHPHQIS